MLQTQEEWERFMQVVPINGVRYVVTPCMKNAVLQARFEDIEAALDSGRPVVVATRSAFQRSL